MHCPSNIKRGYLTGVNNKGIPQFVHYAAYSSYMCNMYIPSSMMIL